ncbi:protein disulfide oxidoreductase [Ursidibacter sp. B-7004-1]
MLKNTIVSRLIKNILLFGSLFIILSIVVDWYRKPSPPAQFAEQVLYDIAQQPKVIAQLSHNKPMLLYFWGSWCQFCDYTSPAIQQFTEQGYEVLGVALKSGTDNDVKQYLTQEKYYFATLNDPAGEFSKSWDIQATPTILMIKDGKIINHTTGLTSYWGLKVRLWLASFAQ